MEHTHHGDGEQLCVPPNTSPWEQSGPCLRHLCLSVKHGHSAPGRTLLSPFPHLVFSPRQAAHDVDVLGSSPHPSGCQFSSYLLPRQFPAGLNACCSPLSPEQAHSRRLGGVCMGNRRRKYPDHNSGFLPAAAMIR